MHKLCLQKNAQTVHHFDSWWDSALLSVGLTGESFTNFVQRSKELTYDVVRSVCVCAYWTSPVLSDLWLKFWHANTYALMYQKCWYGLPRESSQLWLEHILENPLTFVLIYVLIWESTAKRQRCSQSPLFIACAVVATQSQSITSSDQSQEIKWQIYVDKQWLKNVETKLCTSICMCMDMYLSEYIEIFIYIFSIHLFIYTTKELKLLILCRSLPLLSPGHSCRQTTELPLRTGHAPILAVPQLPWLPLPLRFRLIPQG